MNHRGRDGYNPGGQRHWHRIEAPWAPQGHALTTETDGSVYMAWQEDTDGSFHLTRTDKAGMVSGPFKFPDLESVRDAVLRLERSRPSRREGSFSMGSNPSWPPCPSSSRTACVKKRLLES